MEQIELDQHEYAKEYKLYLDYYDIHRFSDNINPDLTIQRTGGDALSLMTEIVTHKKKNTKLFDDPEKIQGPGHSSASSSLRTSINLSLSRVNEHCEMESYQTTPNIQIIPETDLSKENNSREFSQIVQDERNILNQRSEGLLAVPSGKIARGSDGTILSPTAFNIRSPDASSDARVRVSGMTQVALSRRNNVGRQKTANAHHQ